MKRIAKNGEETDIYSKWRKIFVYTQRPGVVKKVKRRTHKRERREAIYWITEQLED